MDWNRMGIQYFPDARVVRRIIKISHNQDVWGRTEVVDRVA